MRLPQPGGCFCGDIRYELGGDPLTLYACHCTDCQRQSGTSFVLSMIVPRDAIAVVRGVPSGYELQLEDGRAKRGRFCGRCSTRLWGEPVKLAGMAVLRPGTLDDTSWLRPIGHIWTRSAQQWVEIPEGGLCFEQQPQGEEIGALLRAWREQSSEG